MNKKLSLYGILIGIVGLILSHTYRPYIYSHNLFDFHIADVIGSIVCVPSSVLFFLGMSPKYSVKKYTIYSTIIFIIYELFGLMNIHGTFDIYDIIAIIISAFCFYFIYTCLNKKLH